MYQTVSFGEFCDTFRSMGRNDQFSYNGKRALFDYLEQLEEDIGEPIELDVIALCCDYSEYSTAVECAVECGWAFPERETDFDDNVTEDDDEFADRCEGEALDWLQDRTTVIEHDSGIIIQAF